ncbi:MAG: hypothetical protein ACE5FJ_06180 [Gemmatimonadales bacterium]
MLREILILALAGCTVVPGLSAQMTVSITDELACPSCTIRSQRVSTLGRLDAPVSPQLYASAERDTHGNFWVAPVFSPYEVAVYGPDGEFLQTRGRQGDGPGEFRLIKRVHLGPGDQVHVFEYGNRYSRFSPGMERLLYTRRLAFQADDVRFMPDGSVLVSHVPRHGERFKDAFYVLDPDGSVRSSFGRFDTDVLDRFRNTEVVFRRLTELTGNRFWASWTTRYRLEQWDLNGDLVVVLERVAPWYPDWTGQPSPNFLRQRPFPRITTAWEDPDRRLWVVTAVPDTRWRAAPRTTALHPDSLAAVGISMHTSFDSVVEVIDLATMRVITRRRFDNLIYGAVGSENLVFVNRGTEWGDVVMDVMQLTLNTTERSD